MAEQRYALVLDVTAEEIKEGIPKHCGKCPFAMALKKAIPAAIQIDVTGVDMDFRIPVDLRHDVFTIASPVAMEYWIDRFDRRNPVNPVRIEVPISAAVHAALAPHAALDCLIPNPRTGD